MSLHRYTLPVEDTHWKPNGQSEVAFTWDYDARSEDLLKLYAKGKQGQWDADTRIDWSLPVDPDDPMQVADAMLPIHGTPLWGRLSDRQKSDIRYHTQVHQLSQFLHGEQGALICTARIVQDVPTIESKFYAATQVMDEARHVEAAAAGRTGAAAEVAPDPVPRRAGTQRQASPAGGAAGAARAR